MKTTETVRRVYPMAPLAVFGACLTALGRMRATIEHHDVERGLIVAVFGGGPLTPAGKLALMIAPIENGRAELVASWRRRGRGDQRNLAILLESVDALLP